jgi:hypothetical protein
MKRRTQLYRFASGDTSAADYSALVRAYSKSGYAASRRTMNVHRVEEMVGVREGDRIRFAARWICGAHSVDAIAIGDPDQHGGSCERCDSRLAEIEFGLIVVYRCYDAQGDLLYVGSTTNGASTRLAAHRKAAWWPLMDPTRTRIEQFDHELQARAAELRAIRAEHPRFNVYGRRSA